MKLFVLAVLLSLCGSPAALAASQYEEGLRELGEGVTAEALKAKRDRIAVLDFADSAGEVTPIGQFLAEELATQLLVGGELKVVDRKLLTSTMKQQRVTHLTPSRTKTVKKLAKAVRAELFVTGSYLEVPEGIQVTATLVSPHSAHAVGAARSTLPKSGPLAVMLKQAVTPPVEAPETTAPPPPEPDTLAVGRHTNDLYELSVMTVQRSGPRVTLGLALENRSRRDMKLLCRLKGTYLEDETGARWTLDVADSREGLCIRGTELGPGEKDQVRLTFNRAEPSGGASFTFTYHELAPRPDTVVTIEGLTLPPPAPTNAGGPLPPAEQQTRTQQPPDSQKDTTTP